MVVYSLMSLVVVVTIPICTGHCKASRLYVLWLYVVPHYYCCYVIIALHFISHYNYIVLLARSTSTYIRVYAVLHHTSIHTVVVVYI